MAEALYKNKNHLYVIFHGSWAFVDNKAEHCIRAYAADIPEHTFTAGSWLGERKIVQGTRHELSIGDWTCAKDQTGWRMREHLKDKFVLFCEADATPQKAYAEITLPRPTAIIPQVPAGSLGLKPPICDSDVMYLVPVFHYAYDKTVSNQDIVLNSTPRTGSPFWIADPPDSRSVTTLHCFAADDMNDRKNGVGDFTTTAALLGYSVNLSANMKATNVHTTIPKMRHRSYEITTFLDKRVDWLHSMCRKKSFSHPSAPAAEPRTLDYTSCGGGGGGS